MTGGDPVVKKRSIPDGVWTKCEKCKATIFDKELKQTFRVCPKCEFHHKITAYERIEQICDVNSFIEINQNLKTKDRLNFQSDESYSDYYDRNRKKTSLNEAIVIGSASIDNRPVSIGVMDFRFMGGSMGTVVGEKVALCAENAVKNKVPLILVTASGGARMQEGLFSLMQMAKTSVAIAKVQDKKLPYIAILANPTTGGVFASYATQADLILVEPGALIGFAGPRVIEKTIKQRLPEGFQTSEFLFKHGMADMIVRRQDQKEIISRFLGFLKS
jgi:acetyl-CoA carboxylase carboxyl transferase subunit beta